MNAGQALDDATAALREVILAGEHYRRAASARLGLTVSESQAISYLLARGPLGQTELGEALGFNTSSTTALVDRLERNGVARRTPHPTDRRRSIVELSESGSEHVTEIRAWVRSAFDDISTEHLPDLTAALRLLGASLERTTAEHDTDEPTKLAAEQK